MTKKDATPTENQDRENKAAEDWQSHHTQTDRFPEEAKGIAETDTVKNAHAAGDGSFGRNDESLVDKEEEKPLKDDNTY
jgi:hypothetical protein